MKKITTNTFRAVSLEYTRMMVLSGAWQAYNQIAEGLFLGMIPIKTDRKGSACFHNQHEEIIKYVDNCHAQRPLKLVISAVEKSELDGEGFLVSEMVDGGDWVKKGVNRLEVNIPDMTATIDNNVIISTIECIRKRIQDKESVYVHCKAGRGRSAMLCAIYLALYGTDPAVPSEMKLDDAINLLKKRRKQVDLHEVQKTKAQEIINIMRSNKINSSDAKTMEAAQPAATTVVAATGVVKNGM